MRGEPLPDDLETAIAGLYDAFAGRPLRPHVEGCPHCVDDSDHAALTAHPLRQLATDQLSKYAHKAMTTWGDRDDFAHFLPRLLELLARETAPWVDEEILLGKLAYADWRTWPAGEVAAVERYLAALWRAQLSTYPAHLDPGAMLRAYSQLFDDLGTFLDAWDADDRAPALRHLADFVIDHWKLLSGTPTGRTSQLAQVASWLRRPATLTRLHNGFFAYSNEPFAAELSQAHEWLAAIAPSTATT
jgi:hypothetical protein